MTITFSLLIVAAISALILLFSKSVAGAFVGFLAFACILEMNMITSTAMHIGSFDINMSEPVEAILGLIALLLIFRQRCFDKLLFVIGLAMLLFVSLSDCVNMLTPYSHPIVSPGTSWDNYFYGISFKDSASVGARNWLILARLFVFAVSVIAASSSLARKDISKIVRVIMLSFMIHIVFVCFEGLTKQLFHSSVSIDIRNLILPSFDSAFNAIQYRGSLVMLHGLTREPSHLATALFLFVLLALLARRSGYLRKTPYGWMLCAVLILVFSSSFSSIAYLASIFGLIIVFVAERKSGTRYGRKDLALLILPFALLAVGVLLAFYFVGDGYYAAKFDNVVGNIENVALGRYGFIESDAGIPRIISMVESFSVFLDRPFLGIGLGSIAPYSGIIALLSGAGVAGAALWLSFLVRYSKIESNNSSIALLVYILFSFGMVGANYGIVYATFWIVLCSLLKRSAHERVAISDPSRAIVAT